MKFKLKFQKLKLSHIIISGLTSDMNHIIMKQKQKSDHCVVFLLKLKFVLWKKIKYTISLKYSLKCVGISLNLLLIQKILFFFL